MKFESVLLDIDGTLWESRALVAEGWNRALFKYDGGRAAATVAEITPLFGKTQKEIADRFLPHLPPEQRYWLIDKCFQGENEVLAESPCQILYDGVAETLQKLAQSHRLFLVSNCERPYMNLFLEKTGFSPYFTDHLCCGDTNKSKVENIRALLEKWGIASGVYVGDTQTDQQSAIEAGIPFLWASYGFGHSDCHLGKLAAFSDVLAYV